MLLRWTERMRNPSSDMVEFIGRDESLLVDDAIPVEFDQPLFEVSQST